MPYLEKCLDSLRNQTIKDIEIICVNDCSPDNSLEYINSIAQIDSRVKVVNHTTNKRQGGAWNSGVGIATGKYLSFVDADDWVDLDYCERISSIMDEDIICASKHYLGDKQSTLIDREKFNDVNGDIRKYILLNGLPFITSFIKRSLIIDNSFKFIENNMYHDFMTILLYFYTDKIAIYEKPGYHYRTDNISIQRSMNQTGFWGRLEVAKIEHEALVKQVNYNKYKDAIDYNFYCLFYRNSLIRAFYGYSILPWDHINHIIEETGIIVPNIKDDKYYNNRFSDLSLLMRMPILLFENLPRPVITVLHWLYIKTRIVLKIFHGN